MKRDKLDRMRTAEIAVLSLRHDVPFWCTLTPRERTRWDGRELRQFFLRNGSDRRRLRNFVRSLCR